MVNGLERHRWGHKKYHQMVSWIGDGWSVYLSGVSFTPGRFYARPQRVYDCVPFCDGFIVRATGGHQGDRNVEGVNYAS